MSRGFPPLLGQGGPLTQALISRQELTQYQTIRGIRGTTSESTLAQTDRWQSYSVAWTATSANPDIGNGTLTAEYIRFGYMINYRIKLDMGTATNYGTGDWRFDVPVTADITMTLIPGSVIYLDTGTAWGTAAFVTWISSTLIAVRTEPTGIHMEATVPHTWATGDRLYLALIYRVA